MDSFEAVVATILEREGYWVRPGFKVELTKAEKRAIGKPSSPRWELDMVAYKGGTNELLVVECKSFLDSPGVRAVAFDGSSDKEAERYKLFTQKRLRTVVLRRLQKQLEASGARRPRASVQLCLAAGKVKSRGDLSTIRKVFTKRGWKLFEPEWLRAKLLELAKSGYEDEVAAVAAKLILRSQTD